jgi:hypothetical protein
MKNIIAAAFAVLGLGISGANAENFNFIGQAEYAIEAQSFSLEAGVEYTYDRFRATAVTNFGSSQYTDFDFAGLEIEVGYSVSQNLELYFRVETDDGLNYEEAVIGLNVRF